MGTSMTDRDQLTDIEKLIVEIRAKLDDERGRLFTRNAEWREEVRDEFKRIHAKLDSFREIAALQSANHDLLCSRLTGIEERVDFLGKHVTPPEHVPTVFSKEPPDPIKWIDPSKPSSTDDAVPDPRGKTIDPPHGGIGKGSIRGSDIERDAMGNKLPVDRVTGRGASDHHNPKTPRYWDEAKTSKDKIVPMTTGPLVPIGEMELGTRSQAVERFREEWNEASRQAETGEDGFSPARGIDPKHLFKAAAETAKAANMAIAGDDFHEEKMTGARTGVVD